MLVLSFLLWLLKWLFIAVTVPVVTLAVIMAICGGLKAGLGILLAYAIFLIGIPIFFLGLPMVAIGVTFAKTIESTRKPFTDPRFSGSHAKTLMPERLIFKLWQNFVDGLDGDGRGWWDNFCRRMYGYGATHWKARWRWAALRNSCNYWSRFVTGIDVSKCRIIKLAGGDVVTEEPGKREWQFLIAIHQNGFVYPRFFCSIALPFRPDRAWMVDLGWKIKLEHNGTDPNALDKDRIKGSVFTPSPWKTLE